MKMNVGVFLNSFFKHMIIDKILPIMPKTHNITVNNDIKSKKSIFLIKYGF